MKHLIIYFLLLFATSVTGQTIPKANPNTWVVDQANVLDDSRVSQSMLEWEHKYKTGVEMAVVTVNSMGDYDANSYALKIGNEWGVGKKGSNNGIIILICMETHDFYIATGYGIEYLVTDSKAKTITQEQIPLLKKGDFTQATINAINDLHSVIGTMSSADRLEWKKKEADAKKIAAQKSEEAFQNFMFWACLIVITFSIVGYVVYVILKRRKIRKDLIDIKKSYKIFISTLQTKMLKCDEPIAKQMINDSLSAEESLRQSDPLRIQSIKERTEFLTKEKAALVKKLEVVEKSILDKNSIVELIKKINHRFSNVDHVGVEDLLDHAKKLEGIQVVNDSNNISNEKDTLERKFKLLTDDLTLRKSIEASDISFSKNEILEEGALKVSKELRLKESDFVKHLSRAKELAALLKSIKNEGAIGKKWTQVKNLHHHIQQSLDQHSLKANELLSFKIKYTTALSEFPSKYRKVKDLLEDAENACRKSDVSYSAKNDLHSVESEINSIKTAINSVSSEKQLPATVIIEYRNKFTDIINKLERIIKKAKSDHDEAQSKLSSSYSSSSSINFSSSSSSSDNNSYGGGSFGGGGAGSTW